MDDIQYDNEYKEELQEDFDTALINVMTINVMDYAEIYDTLQKDILPNEYNLLMKYERLFVKDDDVLLYINTESPDAWTIIQKTEDVLSEYSFPYLMFSCWPFGSFENEEVFTGSTIGTNINNCIELDASNLLIVIPIEDLEENVSKIAISGNEEE